MFVCEGKHGDPKTSSTSTKHKALLGTMLASRFSRKTKNYMHISEYMHA